ncbi:hypothetical protein BCR34DRAFT_488344 [Clohesyomyces aquaticus]|uniref:F-box domain-containing protein n=1 Tax=Clohesyomyces aquaticus TaxID=1231657 RepID=A0A1Y1ZER1_9PLEO|nr:hypothetical protein BCR34DRAFT_488344 [Clohesyomyces aquaticus]
MDPGVTVLDNACADSPSAPPSVRSHRRPALWCDRSTNSERRFESLPDELLSIICDSLPSVDLRNLAVVSKRVYSHATAPLWRKVCLTDTRRRHDTGTDGEEPDVDEHDDTPIIHKLYVLAKNPHIASKVQVLDHRCHLPTPSVCHDLPALYFASPWISIDSRIKALLQLALWNLVNVHTVRIVYGHWRITQNLLGYLFHPLRPRNVELKKLWLESTSIEDTMHGYAANGKYYQQIPTGLESIRFRRLRFESPDDPTTIEPKNWEIVLARGGHRIHLRDGAGGTYETSVWFGNEYRLGTARVDAEAKAKEYDAAIWKLIPEIDQFVRKQNIIEFPKGPRLGKVPFLRLLKASAMTLTKLNLDWIIVRKNDDYPYDVLGHRAMDMLSKLRFPNLLAFQLRNCAVHITRLPPDIYLLDDKEGPRGVSFMDFLEAHPKIRCLAWPLDQFYSHIKSSQATTTRQRKLVAHFGNVLVDVRLDSHYHRGCETFTDGSTLLEDQYERIRRRRFISEFAAYLTKVESIKLEGGIARDEKRELLRALHQSPLQKIVLIGASFPVGNTWGNRGEDLKDVEMVEEETGLNVQLEEEDNRAILSTYLNDNTVPADFTFTPQYGWPPSPPFLHTIAAHHASTVKELKLCGYAGAPILSDPTPITRPLLYNLRHFHKLETLIISMWLSTVHEGERQDKEIIASWLDTRSPSSTALIFVTPPSTPTPLPLVAPTTIPGNLSPAARPQEFNRWAVALKTRFSPSALAYRVAADIAPFLSSKAKERRGGVKVRASFCLGRNDQYSNGRIGDIFDLDVRVGRGGQVLEFVGPREEGEPGRWWGKLEGRGWF